MLTIFNQVPEILPNPPATAGSGFVWNGRSSYGGPDDGPAGRERPMTDIQLGERLARLESAMDWTKIVLGMLAAIAIGGFAFLGVQINRIDTKVDALGARIDAQGAQTRQELIGLANAISNSITATKQSQPQIIVVPTPIPGPTTPPKP
jgi:hypothetical protein